MAGKKPKIGSNSTGNIVIVLGVTFVAALGINSLMSYMMGDDFFYLLLSRESPGFFGFLVGYLIMMQDGRIATASSLWFVFSSNIWLWRICNAVAVTLFCFLVSKIACLIAGEKQSRLMPQVFVCASLAMINSIIVAVSMFTICFSLHYLWACTAGLLALYYPVKEAVSPEKNKAGLLPYCLIAASVYACLAQEQVAAVVVAFLLIITIYRHIEYKKQMRGHGEGEKREETGMPLFLYIQTALSLVIFLLHLFSLALRDRQYHVMSDGSQHVFRALQWLAYNYMAGAKYVLILLWAMLLLRFTRKKQPAYAVLCALFAAAAILSLLLPALTDVGLLSGGPSFLVEVSPDPSTLSSLPVLQDNVLNQAPPTLSSLSATQGIVLTWWLFAIGITPLLLLKALKEEPMRYATLLLYLAGGASACLITATDIMYPTMGRTFFVTVILLVMIVTSLISSIKKPKHMLVAACVFVLFAAAQLRENSLALMASYFDLAQSREYYILMANDLVNQLVGLLS